MAIHSQIRLLEMEERVRNQKGSDQQVPDYLGEFVDKDDLMRRLSEHIDDERYLKMFALFYVVVAKAGEDHAMVFQCKSVEGDLIIEYACKLPAALADRRSEILKAATLYRGVESMMLDDNYRIGLHEYLACHTVDEDLCAAVEHLAIVLRQKSLEQVYSQLRTFALAAVRA